MFTAIFELLDLVSKRAGRLTAVVTIALVSLPAAGAVNLTQTIELRQGWNSVALEVSPTLSQPDDLLAGTPVEIVAAYVPESKPVYFPSNPTEYPWRKEGWLVWYAPQRADAFAGTLNSMIGGRAYLIYSAQNFRWTVAGQTSYQPLKWRPDAFSLTGLPVTPETPPTLQAFFEASEAHRNQRCFQLVDGRWSLVRDPAQTRIRRGEAYWIFCNGTSEYQGPLEVRFLGMSQGIEFRGHSKEIRLDFRNLTARSMSVSLFCDDALGQVPLAHKVVQVETGTIAYPNLQAVHPLSSLSPGQSTFLRLRLRENALTVPVAATVLHVADGQGTRYSFPLTAHRTE